MEGLSSIAIRELVITIGVQGAGKSTWCQKNLFHTHLRLNRDMLGSAERQLTLFHAALATGQNIVVDNTHPKASTRQVLIRLAKACDYRVRGVYFDVNAETAKARNRGRPSERRVPDRAIDGTLAKLEKPTLAEGFDELKVIDDR